MDLFRLVKKDVKKRQEPLSPPSSAKKQTKRNKSSFIPDLCEATDLSVSNSSGDDLCDEELSVNKKLIKAKQRREKADRNRETILNERNEQAFERAQQIIERRRTRFHVKNTRVAKLNEKRTLLEKKRRKHALRSIENRLNSAILRAEENIKSRQERAKQSKRLRNAQNKRELQELERRSSIYLRIGYKAKRAAKNHQLILEDLQGKARGNIEHAHVVARRVKAVRTLQKLARSKFEFSESFDHGEPIYLAPSDAVLLLQNCTAWRVKLVTSRFLESSNEQNLKTLLTNMGLPYSPESRPSFEQVTTVITSPKTQADTKRILEAFHPLLRQSSGGKDCIISDRTLLSAFLVTSQPEEILGKKRGTDKCAILLQNAACKVVDVLQRLSNQKLDDSSLKESTQNIIKDVAANVLAYCTLFEKWKNADFEDLVAKMEATGRQSFIAYLTSKEALAYIEVKTKSLGNQTGLPHFRHQLKYKSSYKGSGSHLKRVQIALKKLVGEDESRLIMRQARKFAVTQIENKNLMVPIKAEIDTSFDSYTKSNMLDDDDSIGFEEQLNIPDNILSNSQLVHNLILMDSEDFEKLAFGTENCPLKSAEEFMTKFQGLDKSFKKDTKVTETKIVKTVSETVEKAFFDSVTERWVRSDNDMEGVKQLMITLISKMRKLIPSRKDLHQYFTEDQVANCKSADDVLSMLLNTSNVMAKSLESQQRSVSTIEWYNVASTWYGRRHEDIPLPFHFKCLKSFLIASLAFLVKKVDLCQSDIVNYQLLQVAPLIRARGNEYELQKFKARYGNLNAMELSDKLSSTWTWLKRMKTALIASPHNMCDALKEGFVDQILFATDATEIPEILRLDMNQIHHLRSRAQKTVISSSLILHACKIINTRMTNSISPEAKYYKNEVLTLLDQNLPYETLHMKILDATSMFAKVMYGKPLEPVMIKTLENSTHSVLKGNDPVFSLMDRRMRCVFKCASKFSPKGNGVNPHPISMRTGRQEQSDDVQKKINVIKVEFSNLISKEAKKLGFNVFEDELVQATYESYKIISHCVNLYGDVIFKPMVNQLTSE